MSQAKNIAANRDSASLACLADVQRNLTLVHRRARMIIGWWECRPDRQRQDEEQQWQPNLRARAHASRPRHGSSDSPHKITVAQKVNIFVYLLDAFYD